MYSLSVDVAVARHIDHHTGKILCRKLRKLKPETKGNLFVGCIFYANDIVLLSGSCHGLQSIVDVGMCRNYGTQFDIRFNPLTRA